MMIFRNCGKFNLTSCIDACKRGNGKATAPRRKVVQEGRQQTSSEDEVDVENTMDKDDQPTYREQIFILSPSTLKDQPPLYVQGPA